MLQNWNLQRLFAKFNLFLRAHMPALLLLLANCTVGHAALPGATDVSLEDCINPVPETRDIMLPMPCKAQMAFIAVGIPAKGYLWDREIRLGSVKSSRPDAAYYENRFTAGISGPFTRNDLPEKWHSTLVQDKSVQYNYYLIGKYEVSAYQWEAVAKGLGGQCPQLTPQGAEPVRNISWFDAQEFINKYTTWLLNENPDSLPSFAADKKNVGYLRLPTETEWEYAARGGQFVSEEVLLQEEFFPLSGESIENFAVFSSDNSPRKEASPSPIGSRKPNPLGLYDTAGNVAEMTMSPFQFSVGGRLHGSTGGFLRKGGSFSSRLPEIMPGRREEVAFFTRGGPVNTGDLGIRLVLSGINTAAGVKQDILRKEWSRAGKDDSENTEESVVAAANKIHKDASVGIQAQQELLQKLSQDNSSNDKESINKFYQEMQDTLRSQRENIDELLLVMKNKEVEVERERAVAAEYFLRSALLAVEDIRNLSVHTVFTTDRAIKFAQPYQQIYKKISPSDRKKYEKQLRVFLENVSAIREDMEHSVLFYKNMLDKVRSFPTEVQEVAINRIKAENQGSTRRNERNREDIRTFEKHAKLVRRQDSSSLTINTIIDSIVMSDVKKLIREKEKILISIPVVKKMQ